MNRVCPSFKRGSLEIMFKVPLILKRQKDGGGAEFMHFLNMFYKKSFKKLFHKSKKFPGDDVKNSSARTKKN